MASRLILVRHAKPESGPQYTDDTRPLSVEGREVQRQVAQHLKAEKVHPNLILTSPLPRAKETAEILGEILGAPVEVEPALGLSFDADTILDRVPDPESSQSLMIVGHEPSMGKLSQELVGLNFLPAGLSKSGTVVVSFEKEVGYGSGQLVAYYDPREIVKS